MAAHCRSCDSESENVYRCSECDADLVDDGKDGSDDNRGGTA